MYKIGNLYKNLLYKKINKIKLKKKENRTKQILHLKNTLSELENSLKGFNIRLDQANLKTDL